MNTDRIKELTEEDGYIIIYKRLSKEGTKGVALEQQEKDARDWLKANGFKDDEEIIVLSDELTGRIDRRPGYQKMIKLLPMTKLIIMNDVTRLSRKMLHILTFEELRKEAKTEMFFTKLKIGSFDDFAWDLMLMLFGLLAQNEVETISSRQRSSKDFIKNSPTGQWIGGNAPYGYTSRKIQEQNSEGKMMNVPYIFNVDEELDILIKIFNQYKQLRSIDKVCMWCDDNNLKDNQDKKFTRSKITEIIRNPDSVIPSKDAYNYFKKMGATINNEDIKEWNSNNGLMCYNRYSYKSKDDKDGKTKHTIQPINEWKISISKKHTGIVPFKLWKECRDIMQKQATNSGKPHLSNEISILNGIIFCRYCGNKMYPKKKYKRSENDDMFFENGDPRFSYRCKMGNNKNTAKECENHSTIKGNEIDKIVLDAVINMFTIDNKELARALTNASKGIFKGNTNSLIDARLKMQKDSLATCLKQQEKYRNILEKIDADTSPLVIKEYSKKLEDSLNEYNDISKEIEITEKELKKEYDVVKEATKIIDILANLRKGFDNMTINEKKDCIKLLVKEVRLDKQQVDITFINDSVKEILLPNDVCSK